MANFSIFFGVTLVSYIVILFGLSIYYLTNNDYLLGFSFLITAISPIIFGNLASFSKINLYINYQLIVMIINLLILIVVFLI